MQEINIKDLQSLNHSYHNDQSSLHFIYGGKRTGKTTFLKDFIVKKNYLYLSCSTTSKYIQISNFAKIISKKFKQQFIQSYFNEFTDILILLSKQNINDKFLIIFDDFHNLLKIDKNELNNLLNFWTKTLQNKNIQIIISSSQIFDLKFNKKLSYFKQNTIYMENIPFSNIKKKKNISDIDKLNIYAFFGSSDFILNYYNRNEDFIKNIYNIALSPNSPFLNYGFHYLKENIGDISTYNSILFAISKKNNKISDIALFINLPASYLSRYISKLIDLMIIKRELPIDDNFKNSKFGRYYINDNFLQFWYCYVFENLSFLNMKKHTSVIKQINSSYLENILQPAYKKYILDLINQNPEKYIGYTPNNLAPWWDNNSHIDLVAYNNTDITFIDILWENPKNAKIQYSKLLDNAAFYKSSLKRNYIIISKNSYLNSIKNQ